ncbi:MAG: DUF362 domain-containing protein [Acidobacteriota bacterium]
MKKRMGRRTFIKKSAVMGTISLFTGGLGRLFHLFGRDVPDISIVSGENYYTNTVKAVEVLGGMKRFVKKGSKVAVLANPQRNNPGAFTSPYIAEAVSKMCIEAGAAEVNFISWLPEKNWESTGLKDAVKRGGGNLKIVNLRDESFFRPTPVPLGKTLKEARIMKELFNNDIFINLPITKDHAGNKFTGTLKNMMGLNSPKSNRTFHKPDWKTNLNSITHLDQSIADLNTILKPDLSIVDATEFIITNGPFGPGKIFRPKKVVAGTDRVAIDSYCCMLWGLDPKDIIMINKAHEHGLGSMNLKKLKISELKT